MSLQYMTCQNADQYINHMFTDVVELKGDRISGQDSSVFAGIGMLDTMPVTIVAQLHGMNMEEQIKRNFSMTKPEGFRKANRVMKQAEKFHRPVVCFIDTVGADPGVEAEEHGQVYSIAKNLFDFIALKTPIISVIIGNGVSGGAMAFCVSDKIAILENATLSVISPKACSEILWKDKSREAEASQLLKMRANNLLDQGIVDCIIPETNGENNIPFSQITSRLSSYILNQIELLLSINSDVLIENRYKKYRQMGRYY